MAARIDIRTAGEGDAGFIAGLAPSLLEFGSPAWRDSSALTPGFRELLVEAVRGQDERSTVLVAADKDGVRLGFISLKVSRDVAGIERGHVADLAVAESARRRGVGRALMGAAETWAREHGFAVLSLDVWSTNQRALGFYRQLGYSAESLCLIRELE